MIKKVINHNCVFCLASNSYQSVRAETVYGGSKEHKFYRCNKCDLVYLWPVPSKKEQQEFYENKFEDIDDDHILPTEPFINADIIDIGCESSRPGAAPVSEKEELKRLSQFMENEYNPNKIHSIDTYKPNVFEIRSASTSKSLKNVRIF